MFAVIVCHFGGFPRSVPAQVSPAAMAQSTHTTGARHHHGRISFATVLKVAGGGLAVALLLAALHFAGFEWRDAPAMLQRVNRPLALALMAILPIAGFPISAVYLAAGAIFG